MNQTAKIRISSAAAITMAVAAVATGGSSGDVVPPLDETPDSTRVLLRVSSDATVAFDTEGGPWIYPDPSLRRPTMTDDGNVDFDKLRI